MCYVLDMSEPMRTTEDPILIDVAEAARLLGVGRTMLYALISRGELGSVKVGNLRKVPRAAVDEYVETLRSVTRA